MKPYALMIAGLVLLSSHPNGIAAEGDATAIAAGKILNDYCYRCHRGSGSSAGQYAFDVRKPQSIIDASLIVPEDPDNSQLIDVIRDKRMPPRNQGGLPTPSPAEYETLRRWVKEGARDFPAPPRRPFISLLDTQRAILNHFQTLPQNTRKDYRYFTLTHLHNDPQVDARQLRMARAALSKALNSLSWEVQPAILEVVSIPNHEEVENGLVYAIDLQRIGWTRAHWTEINDAYPYFVSGESSTQTELRDIERDLIRLSGGDSIIKSVRADWFVTTALQPKLYHRLLYELNLQVLKQRTDNVQGSANPKRMTDLDLEQELGVTVRENILSSRPTAKRTAYNESLISGQNRMLEHHPLKKWAGSYWKSYDFLGSNARSILAEFPLGPKFGDPALDSFAFEHDGGEIIFTLPNGLQGYLLANSQGGRLDAGPIEIVGDVLKTSGNQLIVNGLSCIVCHRTGMIDPPGDEIHELADNFGSFAERIRLLYPAGEEMSQLIEEDRQRFSEKLGPMIKPYLLRDDDADRTIDELPEPIGETSRRFLLEPLSAETVAAELYLSETAQTGFRDRLRLDGRLRRLGLAVLSRENGTIKRAIWENQSAGRSLMQITADIIDGH